MNKTGKQWVNFTRRLLDEACSVQTEIVARLAAEKPVQHPKEQ
jgi:hypothetical protein